MNRPLKIFSHRSNYRHSDRYHVNNIIKALWNDRLPEERRSIYGSWVDFYVDEPDITQADVCILTYQWNYYVSKDLTAEAIAEVSAAHTHKKSMLVFNGGDYPARLPFEDVLLFESAGYRSTPGLRYHSAQPSYINDYVQDYCGGSLELRKKREQPIIGFCGLASTSALQTAWRSLRLKWLQQRNQRGKLKWEPAPFETSTFRANVLNQFAAYPDLVRTNYIRRKLYKAGRSKHMDAQDPAKLAFIRNIIDSDYTVCMRGGGNFSVRFYETLCLGRIPIFIDTDCLLPFQDEIDYKAYFPWIDIRDLPQAAQIVRDFHNQLSPAQFIGLQKLCRYLWQEHMTPDGFHRDLVRKIKCNFIEKPHDG